MSSKFAIAAAFVVCAICGGVTPAFAGDWVEITDYESEAENRLEGSVSYNSNEYRNGYLQHLQGSYDWNGKNDYMAGFVPLEVYGDVYGGSFSIGDHGKRRSKFRYVPQTDWMTMEPDPNDTPPEYLNLKITASATGFACSDTSGQLRNTSKEHITSASVEVPSHGVNSDMHSDGDVQTMGSTFRRVSNSINNRLVSVATNGQYEVWGPLVKYDVDVTVDGGRTLPHYDEGMGSYDEYLPGQSHSWLSYTAQSDDRSVQITSPTIETSYRYATAVTLPLLAPAEFRSTSPVPPADGPYSVKNRRSDNGSMTVDTVVALSQVDTIPGVIPQPVYAWTGWASLQALHPNFSNPQCEWSFTGPGVSVQARDILATGNLDGPFAQGNAEAHFYASFGADTSTQTVQFPLVNEVKVSVTDTDGAVGENIYTINWHRPFEAYQNLTIGGLPKDDIKFYYGSVTSCDVAAENNINTDGSPVIFIVHKTLLGTIQDYVAAGLDALSIPATLAAPEWQMVLMALQQSGPIADGDEEPSVTQNTEGMFNNAKGIGIVPQDAIFEEWHLTKPFQYAKYHVNLKRGSKYDVNGYAGTDDRVIAEKFADGAAGEYTELGDNQ